MPLRRRSASYRSSSALPLLLLAGTGLLVVSLAGLGTAWALGAFKSDQLPAQTPVDRSGQIAFPALARPVNAFEPITRDDLINPQTRQLHVVWLPEAQRDLGLRDLSEIVGRVVRRDKAAGMVLTENDFLPKGTRPGVSAGVPPGKLAVSIPTSGVPGLEQLRSGDRFDLLVALPERDTPGALSNAEPAALFGGIKPPSLRVGQLARQHGVKRLVTDALLVTFAQGAQNSSSSARTAGPVVPPSSSRNRSAASAVKYAEIAVAAEEIGALTEAISMGSELVCVIRSGQPGDAQREEFSADGLVPVITTARDVPAFTALTEENLIDEGTGQLHYYYFVADKIGPAWITDPAALYGRVAARPLRRGSMVSESDLLPVGSGEGISAGVPPGMVAMALEIERVQGIDQLQQGDRFAILTRLPQEVAGGTAQLNWATLYGGRLTPEDDRVEQMLRTGIREVVPEAIFLSQSDTGRVTVAVPELEAVRVAQLLRDDADIFVVTKSSRSTDADSPAEEGPPAVPPSPFAAHVRPDTPADARLITTGDADRADLLVTQSQLQDAGNTVPFPVLTRDVQAFEPLTLADFVDSGSGRLRMMHFPADVVQPDWQGDVRQLIDRVAARPLQAGRTVRERDLAPQGVLPGPSAGVPSGMQGLTVNSLQVQGLQMLAQGSVFDLVAADGAEISRFADTSRRSLASSDAVAEAAKLPRGRVPIARVVAADAVLVSVLGETEVTLQRRVGAVQRQSQTRIDGDGSLVTETVIDDPATTSLQLSALQFVIAVPEAVAGQVLGMLDVDNPLHAAVRSQASGYGAVEPPGAARAADAPIRAVVIEHVRAADISTELFVTDRVETLLDEGR